MNKPLRIHQRFVILVSACLLLLSCKKLIEIPTNPSDKIPTDMAFSDSTNVLNVLSGIYGSFMIVDNGAAPTFFNGGIGIYTGLSADELINRDLNLLPYQSPYYNNSLLPIDGYLAYMWNEAFKTVYTVNISLQSIEKSNGISSSFKQRVSGELKFLRAWVYFNMTNMFGDLPIVTGTDFRTNAVLPREPQQVVYEFILKDLNDANAVLLPEYPSPGRARPNLYTAKALLAKVHLYLGNWQQAAAYSGEVIDAGLYSLELDLNNVFLNGSTEAIWQYPSENASFSQTNDSYVFMPDVWNPGGIPKFELTSSLFDAFEQDDSRKLIWTAAEDVNGTIYNYPAKYRNNDAGTALTQEDYTFFRLAEQYLIRAEARAQLDLPEEGLEDMNMIRRRAALADKSLSDKETLLNDILHERKVELFCEWGHRWFDLKRLNKTDEVLGSKTGWQSTDVLYPIPFFEIQKNPFLTQNPGY